jgi:UDP-N-acetylmuramate--alanine ligase
VFSPLGYPEFDLVIDQKNVGKVTLPVTGKHQIYNALASAAAAHVSGIDAGKIIVGLEKFKGAARRMDYQGEVNGARVYDDYGHHPTEIFTTLEGAKSLCSSGRLICVFQPHTYSRTHEFFEKFKKRTR